MYNFYRTYSMNPADILDWTSTDSGTIELPYSPDQFLLDAHQDALPEAMPYDGDEDDETAVDEYCSRIDAVWSGCTVTARLALDFLTEEPAAAFFVTITTPSGEAWEIIGNTDVSAESAAEIIAEYLRRGAAGVTEETATGYRNALMLYRLICTVNGEHIPDDEISSLLSKLQSAGASPQQIADRLTA